MTDKTVSPSVFYQQSCDLSCRRCGGTELLNVTERGIECVDRSACNQRKANR